MAEGELPPLLDPFSLSCLAAGNLFLAASLSRGAAINVKRCAVGLGELPEQGGSSHLPDQAPCSHLSSLQNKVLVDLGSLY